MKRKIISSFLAMTAVLSLLTGCSTGSGYEPYSTNSTSHYIFNWHPDESTSSVISENVSENTSTVNSSAENTSTANTPTNTSSVRSSAASSSSSSLTEPQNSPLDLPINNRKKVIDTESEEFVPYTTVGDELFSRRFDTYLYDFRTRMSVGYALADPAHTIPVEADYGLKGQFDGSVASVMAYDHTDKNIKITGSHFKALDESVNKTIAYDLSYNIKRFNAEGLSNGLYALTVDFSTGNSADLYFIVNGNDYLFCEVLSANETSLNDEFNINSIRKRRAHLFDLINAAKLTTVNTLDVDIIYYPQEDYYFKNEQIWRCDTSRWAGLSDALVEDNWSDDRKAFVICDWLSQHIAYDRYVRDVLQKDRAKAVSDYIGDYGVWELEAGVCRDFSNILVIMLREQGIPADVISNDTHMWNVIYLNGQWMEVDLCLSMSAYVDEDTTVRIPSGNSYRNLLCMAGQSNSCTFWGDYAHRNLYLGQEYFKSLKKSAS